MTPGPKTTQLIGLMTGTAELLRKHGEVHWSNELERDAEWLRRCDPEGIRSLLSLSRGLSDIWLASAANEQLSSLLDRMFKLANELRRSEMLF